MPLKYSVYKAARAAGLCWSLAVSLSSVCVLAVFGNFRWERRQLQQLQPPATAITVLACIPPNPPTPRPRPDCLVPICVWVCVCVCSFVCTIWKLFVSMTNDSNLSKSCNLPNGRLVAQVQQRATDRERKRERGSERVRSWLERDSCIGLTDLDPLRRIWPGSLEWNANKWRITQPQRQQQLPTTQQHVAAQRSTLQHAALSFSCSYSWLAIPIHSTLLSSSRLVDVAVWHFFVFVFWLSADGWPKPHCTLPPNPHPRPPLLLLTDCPVWFASPTVKLSDSKNA